MQNLGALGVGVAILVVILAVTFLVMSQLKTQVVTQGPSTSIINESITGWANGTAVDLANNCMGVSCSEMNNGSSAAGIINAAAYTCSVSGDANTQITIINDSFAVANITYLDYTCQRPSNAFNATSTLQNATQTIPAWIPLILLVVIGGIILTLVNAFGIKR